jgi:uncharacterized protein YjbI with pentapeptide repeats
MLNDLAVFVYEPFAEWTEQVTKWGATIVSTPEEASVIVCDAKPKERLANKPKILYPIVLERMVSHGRDFVGVDFSNTSLKQGYLCGLNLATANFANVNLSHVNFEGSNLADVNFTKAGLNLVNFERCNLLGIILEKTNFNRCKFEGALVYQGTKNGAMNGGTIIGPNVKWMNKDVSGVSIRCADLSISHFENVSLQNTDCIDVNFSETVFINVDCTGVDFSGANLKGTDLSGATLSDNTFTMAHFDSATKWPAGFGNSSIGAIGPGAVISNMDFNGQEIANWDLKGASLTEINFSGATLTGVDFEGATIEGCRFTMAVIHSVRWPTGFDTSNLQALLPGSNLSRLDLSGREFSEGLDLSGADFTGANLSGSRLHRIAFAGAKFDDADCSGVSFDYSDLNGASFQRCNLQNATLNQTNKNGTNFFSANIKGLQWGQCGNESYTLKNALLTAVEYDASTRWPHPAELYQAMASPNPSPVLVLGKELTKFTNEASLGELHVLQSILQDAEERLELRIIMESLQIAVHCMPDLSEIRFEFESHYNDEGGYNLNFQRTNQTEPFFRWWGYYHAEIRKSSVVLGLSDGWLKPPAPDPNFQHPMLNLFEGYTSKTPETWSKMWTLLTSLKPELRKQGQSFLEALVVSDSDLREHLVEVGSQTLHSEYVSRLYDAKLGFWHLFYLDINITAEEEAKVEDLICSGIHEVYPDERWHQPRAAEVRNSNILFRGVDGLFLPVIHLALTEAGVDTTKFLQDSEVLLGKPLL